MSVKYVSMLVMHIIISMLVLGESTYAEGFSGICDMVQNSSLIVIDSKTSGYDFLNVINFDPKKSCHWTINKGTSEKVIDLTNVVLAPKDQFKIEGKENKTTNVSIIYQYDGKMVVPGLIFCQKYEQIDIMLQFDANNIDPRTVEMMYYQDYSKYQLLKDSGKFTLPLNQNSEAKFPLAIGNFSILPGLQFSDRKIMLSSKEKTNVTFTIDEKNLSEPFVYMAPKTSVNFTIREFFIGRDLKIQIEYWLINQQCSGEFTLSDDQTSKDILYPDESIREKNSLTGVVCAQIFHAPKGVPLQLSFDKAMNRLPNSGDTIAIYSLPGLESRQVVDSSSLSYYKSRDLVFNDENILVIYDSPYGSKSSEKVPSIKISTTTNSIYRLNAKNLQQKIAITKGPSKKTINIYSDLEKNLIVRMDPNKLPSNKMTIEIFNTDDLSKKEPIVSLKEFDVLPPAITVNSNMMRIELSGEFSPMNLTVEQVQSTDCASISTFDPAFKVDGSNDCHWLIPANSANEHTILSPINMNFGEGASLEVVKLGAKSSSNIIKGPMNESYLPDYVMESSSSYLVNFLNNSNKTKANVLILEKSNFLKAELVVDNYQSSYSLKSVNYPGNYPVNFMQKWNIGTKAKNVSVLITVKDFQFIDNHILSINNPNQIVNLNNQVDIDSVRDLISPSPLAVFFDTQNTSIFARSGRGFDIELIYSSSECGGNVDLTDSKTHSIKFNSSQFNNNSGFPVCIWRIQSTKKGEKLEKNVLNFNITIGSPIKDNKASLEIYDTISKRVNHSALCRGQCLDSTTTNTTGYYQGSIGEALIIYDFSQSLATKANFSLEIIIQRDDCRKNSRNQTYCSKFDRCMTEMMVCNQINDCGDWSDERYCSGVSPPVPAPTGGGGSGGVNAWVVLFILMPLGALLGILGYVYFPRLMGKFNHGRYSEFGSDLSEVS